MKSRAITLGLPLIACCFWPALTGHAQEAAPSVSAPSATDELHAAPQVQAVGAPAEAQLSPPPDAEKVELPAGYLEVRNPAFPQEEIRSVELHRGRRYGVADVEPYFASGPGAAAKAEFDRGHYERTRQLLGREPTFLPFRYLAALAAMRGSDFAAAANEMSLLAIDYPALRDRCLTHAGVAREELHQFESAAAMFSAVPVDSKLFVDARLGLSRVMRRKKDLAGAIDALRPLSLLAAPSWGRDVGAESLAAIADLAHERKDSRTEKEALIRLWSLHPLSPLAGPAERRFGGKATVSLEALVGRAETLIDAHRNKPGLDVLEPLLPRLVLPDPLACRAHFVYGKGLRKERKHLKAIEALSPVVDKCREGDLRARALYVLGSSQSISDLGNAAHTYETLAHDFPTHSFADDALFYAADVYSKVGDNEAALARLKELAQLGPDGDFLAEALFKAFWILRSAGKPDQGLVFLDQTERQFGNADESYDVERARYWRARVSEDKGDKASAAASFERLAIEHPATYYGLISRAKLESLDPQRFSQLGAQLAFPSRTASPWPLHAGRIGDDPHFLTGVELLRLGFPEAVSSELLAVSRTRLPEEAVRLIVQLLSLAGDFRSAHAVARVSLRQDLSGRISEENRAVWEVAYPNAFRPFIEKHCKAAKELPPDLLQALMREESALDPKALSWAGALGLTQLMPSTAAIVAKQLKMKRLTTEKLLDPETNIRLGATYLGNLYRRYNGVKQYALAGYNAGEGAVDRWRKQRPADSIDEWVENIPIAETRGYVKRVLRSYNTYQLLYSAPRLPAPGSAHR